MNDLPPQFPLLSLRAFLAVAENGSVSAAAEALGVTQGAVSHHIKKLEQWLGHQLCYRRPRGMELSPMGERLQRVSEGAFGAIAEEVVRMRGSGGDAPVRVHTYSTFAALWLVPRLDHLHDRHPGLKVLLTTDQHEADFARDDLDCAICLAVPGTITRPHVELFGSEIFPVCAPALLEEGLAIEALLTRHRRIEVYSAPDDWPDWLRAAGLRTRRRASAALQVDSYLLAMEAAIAGQGIAIARSPFVTRHLERGLLARASPVTAELDARWCLFGRQGAWGRAAVQRFADWLGREAAGSV